MVWFSHQHWPWDSGQAACRGADGNRLTILGTQYCFPMKQHPYLLQIWVAMYVILVVYPHSWCFFWLTNVWLLTCYFGFNFGLESDLFASSNVNFATECLTSTLCVPTSRTAFQRQQIWSLWVWRVLISSSSCVNNFNLSKYVCFWMYPVSSCQECSMWCQRNGLRSTRSAGVWGIPDYVWSLGNCGRSTTSPEMRRNDPKNSGMIFFTNYLTINLIWWTSDYCCP